MENSSAACSYAYTLSEVVYFEAEASRLPTCEIFEQKRQGNQVHQRTCLVHDVLLKPHFDLLRAMLKCNDPVLDLAC